MIQWYNPSKLDHLIAFAKHIREISSIINETYETISYMP